MKKKKPKVNFGDDEKIAIKGALGAGVGTTILAVGAPTGFAAIIGISSAPVWLPAAAIAGSVLTVYAATKILNKKSK